VLSSSPLQIWVSNLRQYFGQLLEVHDLSVQLPRESTYGCCKFKHRPLVRQIASCPQHALPSSDVQGNPSVSCTFPPGNQHFLEALDAVAKAARSNSGQPTIFDGIWAVRSRSFGMRSGQSGSKLGDWCFDIGTRTTGSDVNSERLRSCGTLPNTLRGS
jgi:hypothetical protein